MKRILFFLSFCTSLNFCFAIDNETSDFITKFNQVVITLRFEKFQEALPMLNELDKLDPNNPNIQYLKGVCYVATNTQADKALELLQNSVKYSTNEYMPSYYKERRTPIYALYYLGVSYCYHKRCEEAKKVFDEFTSIIADNSNDYVKDAKARLAECTGPVTQIPVASTKPTNQVIAMIPTIPDSVKTTANKTTTPVTTPVVSTVATFVLLLAHVP